MIEKRTLKRKDSSGRPKVSYDVRLRGPDGKEYCRSFPTKKLAEKFESGEKTDRHRGNWIDPRYADLTVATLPDAGSSPTPPSVRTPEPRTRASSRRSS